MEQFELVESDLDQPKNGRPKPAFSLRRSLNSISLFILITLIAASAYWWTPIVRQKWASLFPYTGPIVVVQTATGLVGLRASNGQVEWRNDHVKGDIFHVTLNGVGYFNSALGNITAVREQDGYELWHSSSGESSILGIDTRHLYYMSNKDPLRIMLVAANLLTGATVWETTVNANLMATSSSPGTISFCSESGATTAQNAINITTYDTQTGKELWSFSKNVPIMPTSFNCASNASTVFLLYNQYLYAFDHSSGKLIWQTLTSGIGLFIDQSIVFLFNQNQSTQDNSLMAFNAQTGQQLWNIPKILYPLWTISPQGSYTTMQISRLLLMQTATGIAGVEVNSGAVVWQKNFIDQFINSSVRGSGNTVFLETVSSIIAIDGTNGAVQWTSPHFFTAVNSTLIKYQNGAIYASSIDIVKIDSQTGKVLWVTPLIGQLIDTTE